MQPLLNIGGTHFVLLCQALRELVHDEEDVFGERIRDETDNPDQVRMVQVDPGPVLLPEVADDLNGGLLL